MSVYIDVIWLLNFLFDTLLLYLTAILLKRKCNHKRLILGGLIGSIIVILTITPFHAIAGKPFVKLLFSLLMILAAFGYRRLRYFLTGLLTLYLTTFLTGGILIGTHYFVRSDIDLSTTMALAEIKGFGDPISWIFVLIGFPLAWHFTKKNVERITVSNLQYDQFVNIEITMFDKTFQLRGLVDSGNSLYDPISKLPVMVVSMKKLASELPAFLSELSHNSELLLTDEIEIPIEWQRKLRIIPCKVVGQEHQLICAVKPDALSIWNNDNKWESPSCLLSFTNHQLSGDDVFDCIVHPKMLTGTVESLKKNVS